MRVFAVPDLPEFRPGDSIAAAIEDRTEIRDGDVVCVASTIVSKVEERTARLEDFDPGPRAEEIATRLGDIHDDTVDPRFVQAVLNGSDDLLTEAPFVLTRTPFGHVGVNAGVDRSNTGGTDLLLLPESPAESAERIRADFDAEPAVIVTDTSGRPFRTAQRGVAIGWAGIPATRDWRGETDRDGHELEVTVEAIVDELAAAANLVTGEGDDGLPVAVIREFTVGDHDATDRLFRQAESDYVRSALAEWEYDAAVETE
jgi:coenzyme F420-0:L-glutamate ligase/coenzyme F420-1:gamma-L-glutamate ligase